MSASGIIDGDALIGVKFASPCLQIDMIHPHNHRVLGSGVSMDLSPESFMQACREGGRLIDAWLRRFDREHGAALYREAASVLRDWHAAEDVVQEALVKVWQRCSGYRGDGHPVGWVRMIVRRALLDLLRARRPDAPLHDDDGELSAEAAHAVQQAAREAGDEVVGALHQQQLDELFQRSLQRFAAAHPEQAMVLRWVAEEGLDNEQLQRLLGRSPGATREYLSQCRKKARPYFAEWHALASAGPA
jgi:RNA polymerase sigma factor (sigma-70 family)